MQFVNPSKTNRLNGKGTLANIMRPWFTIVAVLIFGGILVALSIPAVFVGISKTDATEALNNCRQLQIAVGNYIKKNNSSPPSLSALHAEGFLDNELFDNLSGAKGLYVIYCRQDMKKEDVFIEAFLLKVHVTMTAGGDGMITPIKHHNNNQL